MNQFKRLNEDVSKLSMYYADNLQLKLGVTPEGLMFFETKNGKVYFDGFTKDGLTYLFVRLGTYVNRGNLRYTWKNANKPLDLGFREQHRVRLKQQFVDTINDARDLQVLMEKKRTATEEYIGAFEVKNNKLYLAGLMTNYNPVSHEKVLTMIQDANLEEMVTWFTASNKELKVYFEGKKVPNCDWKWGLVVYNGHTGHRTLGYGLYMEFGDQKHFMPDVPFVDRKRHLSPVFDFQDNLADVMQKTMQINIDMVLQNMVGSLFAPKIKRSKAISDGYKNVFEHYKDKPIIQYYMRLVRDINTKGKKTAAKKAVDFLTTVIFNEAMER